MNPQTIYLQASISVVRGIAHVIDQLNNTTSHQFKYKVDLTDPGASTIEVTSEEVKSFYALGIASADLMKKMIVIK